MPEKLCIPPAEKMIELLEKDPVNALPLCIDIYGPPDRGGITEEVTTHQVSKLVEAIVKARGEWLTEIDITMQSIWYQFYQFRRKKGTKSCE